MHLLADDFGIEERLGFNGHENRREAAMEAVGARDGKRVLAESMGRLPGSFASKPDVPQKTPQIVGYSACNASQRSKPLMMK